VLPGSGSVQLALICLSRLDDSSTIKLATWLTADKTKINGRI